MAAALGSSIPDFSTIVTNARHAKRCHHTGALKMCKNFFHMAALQSADADDEWIFRLDEYYSSAGGAWQV
jgi:hypothetical protein